MFGRKGKHDSRAIFSRGKSAAAEDERPDSADHVIEAEETGGVADSSFDLINGVGVSEAPMESFPGDLIDEFLKDSELPDHDEIPTLPAIEFRDSNVDVPLDFIDVPIADVPLDLDLEEIGSGFQLLDEPISAIAEDTPPDPPPEPELIESDPEPPWPEAFLDRDSRENNAVTAARAAAKSAHRAKVRRARLAAALRERGETSIPDLLLLDQDHTAHQELSGLLAGFGFCVHSARNIAHADEMLAERPFAAVILDIVVDEQLESAWAALCLRVRRAKHGIGHPPALVIMSDRTRSVDRVRAELAGGDGLLLKPLTRGGVIRTLEDCGVPLPVDARRR